MPQNYRFQLLAPLHSRTGSAIGRSMVDEELYRRHFASMQRLRGRVYLKDGAIQPWELDDTGRFHMQGDEQSWHFLLIDDQEEVIGCARYLLHPDGVGYDQLRLRHSAIANDPSWGEKVRSAVEADLEYAQREGLSYVELGGWALSEEWRGTKAALEILLASYAWAQSIGNCICACTATVRNNSASILRRIGGKGFQAAGESLPTYNDPQYGCLMELLRFDSRSVDQRFVAIVDQIKSKLSKSVVIAGAKNPVWAFPSFQTRRIASFMLAS